MSAENYCPDAVVDFVAYLESGQPVAPLFFVDANCSEVWPPREIQPMQMSQLYHRNDVGVCPNNPLGPEPLRTDCPLPQIATMFVPDGVKLTFTSHIPDDIKSFVTETGTFVLDSAHSTVKSNIWSVDTTWASEARWTKEDGITGCGYDIGKPADIGWDDSNTKVKLSLVSCGAPFWPSFGRFQTGGKDQPTINEKDDTKWKYHEKIACSTTVYDFLPAAAAAATPGVYSMLSSVGAHTDLGRFLTCADHRLAPTYSSFDCVTTHDEFMNDSVGLHCGINKIIPPFCTCVRPIFGSVGTFQADRSYQAVDSSGAPIQRVSDWQTMQFVFCTAPRNKRYTFAGITIQRYAEGSDFCDSLVTDMCQDTTVAQTYPDACRCILRQQAIQTQFASINLPVQCFLSLCDDTTDGVYRTKQQQSGCSARICSQVISVHGNSILSQGYQTLECDGQIYNVADTARNAVIDDGGDFSNATQGLNLTAKAGFHFGTEFFASLGMLVIVLFLLLLWGLNRWVQHRHVESNKKALEVKVITQLLSQKSTTTSDDPFQV